MPSVVEIVHSSLWSIVTESGEIHMIHLAKLSHILPIMNQNITAPNLLVNKFTP